jgi:hypothetical protein
VGDSKFVAKQMANIIKIMISRMSFKSRVKALRSVRSKLLALNPAELKRRCERLQRQLLKGTEVSVVPMDSSQAGQDPS